MQSNIFKEWLQERKVRAKAENADGGNTISCFQKGKLNIWKLLPPLRIPPPLTYSLDWIRLAQVPLAPKHKSHPGGAHEVLAGHKPLSWH